MEFFDRRTLVAEHILSAWLFFCHEAEDDATKASIDRSIAELLPDQTNLATRAATAISALPDTRRSFLDNHDATKDWVARFVKAEGERLET